MEGFLSASALGEPAIRPWCRAKPKGPLHLKWGRVPKSLFSIGVIAEVQQQCPPTAPGT